MKPGDEKMTERLASLTGAEFEIAFMEMMIKHHEKAIKEGRHCLDKAYHAELRELSENIITTQSAELAKCVRKGSSLRKIRIQIELQWKHEDDCGYSRKRVARRHALHAREDQA